jgi:hypothetical protein
MAMNFSITSYEQQVVKPGFHLSVLKAKSNQSSGCAHVHQTSKNVLKNVCQQADDSCFLGQERSADGGILATRDHSNVRSVSVKH